MTDVDGVFTLDLDEHYAYQQASAAALGDSQYANLDFPYPSWSPRDQFSDSELLQDAFLSSEHLDILAGLDIPPWTEPADLEPPNQFVHTLYDATQIQQLDPSVLMGMDEPHDFVWPDTENRAIEPMSEPNCGGLTSPFSTRNPRSDQAPGDSLPSVSTTIPVSTMRPLSWLQMQAHESEHTSPQRLKQNLKKSCSRIRIPAKILSRCCPNRPHFHCPP